MSKDAGVPPETARIQELQNQINEMKSALNLVAQASCIEHVMQQGFERISTQLEPLRDMSEKRQFPSPAVMVAYTNMLNAIAQPKWSGSDYRADVPDHCKRSPKS